MHLASLRLRDFRNYARLDAEFSPGFHLFLGQNAQGKTNLLEAIYLLSTLRSFRGVGGAQMIRFGQSAYFVGGSVLSQAAHDIKLYWSARQKRVTLDGQPLHRLADYWGILRAVVFCSEDLLLIKGTSRVRRRFMDLLLAQTHPEYLPLLQHYAKALRARNALLKQPVLDAATLDSFTRQLVKAGNQIIAYRRALLPDFAPLARQAHARIARQGEELQMDYHSSIRQDFTVELAATRDRERILRITLVGPHRDDLRLQINGQSAAQYASEGQKRTLAIAMKMAQAEYLTRIHGTPPVLLIDDVMGELDVERRSGLLPILDHSSRAHGQVFMTGTEENWPRELGLKYHRWIIKAGTYRLHESEV